MRVAIKDGAGVRIISASDVTFDSMTGELAIKPIVGNQISMYLHSDAAVRMPGKLTQLLETGFIDLCSD